MASPYPVHHTEAVGLQLLHPPCNLPFWLLERQEPLERGVVSPYSEAPVFQCIVQVDDTLLPGDATEHSVHPLKGCRCIAEVKRDDPKLPQSSACAECSLGSGIRGERALEVSRAGVE